MRRCPESLLASYLGVASGELREMPIQLVGVFVQDSVMATAKRLMAQPDPADRLDDMAGELVAFLLHGLSAV